MKIKSITPVGKHDVYDICVEDTHSYVLANGVVTHNSGLLYSADTVINITRSQEKEGKELVGYNFTLNVMKSRHSREKSQVPLTVTFENGINKYSGLLEIAEMAGVVSKPSVGWYSRVNPETGELEEKKWRARETSCPEFWDGILSSKAFNDWVEKRYKVVNGKLIIDELDEENPVGEVPIDI